MEGTLASSMAKGIINAAIVLTALSDDYVQSDYCKQEAILANKMKRKIVPLKMADYKPDGWLDLLIAGLKYVDFSSTQSFTGQLKKLESEIENRLEEVAAEGPPVEDEANSDETQDERETSGNSSEAESMEDHNSDPMMTLREPKGIRIKAPPDGCSHHIMISYCYKQQKKVAKIRAHLNKVGYKVWSDENMEGTLLSTKARGIKNAAIVLIALSDDYVQNYDCKKEAILAKEKKRKIIPMKMADYKPDPWLALLIAGLSSVDFSSTQSFTGQLKKLKSKIEKGLEKLREVEKKESM
ncbi:uncharacterized protein LOC118418703 [Branchiostoma floridae]|uniref:Uncharacterized protein LOC118418703 n=1 Tax=Branchiostoma floridae TaxID=7739 RepID=A0A9J7MTM8_BRAFL|nr:uncharacterized protein LOC118418703 [Branchiostoma floridae]